MVAVLPGLGLRGVAAGAGRAADEAFAHRVLRHGMRGGDEQGCEQEGQGERGEKAEHRDAAPQPHSAHAGDFDGAVAEMMNAARKMPGNPHVLFNAALALLRHIENRGWNEAFAAQASALIERAQRLSPANPRLTAITEFMHELMKRFGIAPGRPQPKPRPA